MHAKSKSDHFRSNCRSPRPCLDDCAISGFHTRELFHQSLVNIGTFFQTSCHRYQNLFLLFLFSSLNNEFIGKFPPSCFYSARGLSPWSFRRLHSNGSTPLSSSMRMVHRIHCFPANIRSFSL